MATPKSKGLEEAPDHLHPIEGAAPTKKVLETSKFSRAEISTLLGNLATITSRPVGWPVEGIPNIRLTNLKKFAEAVLETIQELEGDGSLRWEEAVYSLVGLAFVIQIRYVNNSEVIPNTVVSKATLDKIRALVETE